VYAYARPAYDDYFVRNDGELFGIAGQTAAIEAEISNMRRQLVKVWGSLREPAPDFNGHQIVVSEIILAALPPTPTPRAQTAAEALINVRVANVRTGPGTAYTRIGQVYGEEIYDIVGRSTSGTWWQICCPRSQTLWVYGELVDATGNTASVPVVQTAPVATPVPRPTPVQITEWRGEYFANPELAGNPALVTNEEKLDFDWHDRSPSPGLPADDFSARWTRSLPFAQGDYRFFAKADDGIRVWLDDWLVLDQWHTGPVAASGDFEAVGGGLHSVRVEYFEHLGDASASVWWAPTSTTDWLAEYYDDIYLGLPPVIVRNDTNLDFNWGLGSPDPALPADNFSVRWTRTAHFEPGNYYFSVEGGDGARLWLDDWLIFSDWLQDTGAQRFEGEFQALGAGTHVVRVEWYSRGGVAKVKAWWKRIPGHEASPAGL